jgi:hypothetical protein
VATLGEHSPRRAIWRARLGVALRWFWPHDLVILTAALEARILTGSMLGPHPEAVELNPLAAALTARLGFAAAAIGTAVLVGAVVLALQTVCVAFSRAGKLVARVATWTTMVLLVADALWDVAQVVPVLTSPR